MAFCLFRLVCCLPGFDALDRLSGLENGLLGLSSKVNAVVWAEDSVDVNNLDIICFGHLLYEMCTGFELTCPQPSQEKIRHDLDRLPQVNHLM